MVFVRGGNDRSTFAVISLWGKFGGLQACGAQISAPRPKIPKGSPHDEFAKTRGGRRAVQKPLNGNKLSAHHLASMGKIQGTLCISDPINLRKCKSGDHARGASPRFATSLNLCS